MVTKKQINHAFYSATLSSKALGHCPNLLWELQQFHYFGTEFLNFIVVKSEFQGASRLKIGFSSRPAGFVWINSFFESAIGEAPTIVRGQTRICRIHEDCSLQTLDEAPLILFSIHSVMLRLENGETVRFFQSETFHCRNCRNGVDFDKAPKSPVLIFSKIPLTCSGVRTVRLSACP